MESYRLKVTPEIRSDIKIGYEKILDRLDSIYGQHEELMHIRDMLNSIDVNEDVGHYFASPEWMLSAVGMDIKRFESNNSEMLAELARLEIENTLNAGGKVSSSALRDASLYC